MNECTYKCEINDISDVIEEKIKEYNESKIFGKYYRNIEKHYPEKDKCMIYNGKYHGVAQNNIFDINLNYTDSELSYVSKYSKKYFHNGREIEIPVYVRNIKELEKMFENDYYRHFKVDNTNTTNFNPTKFN